MNSRFRGIRKFKRNTSFPSLRKYKVKVRSNKNHLKKLRSNEIMQSSNEMNESVDSDKSTVSNDETNLDDKFLHQIEIILPQKRQLEEEVDNVPSSSKYSLTWNEEILQTDNIDNSKISINNQIPENLLQNCDDNLQTQVISCRKLQEDQNNIETYMIRLKGNRSGIY